MTKGPSQLMCRFGVESPDREPVDAIGKVLGMDPTAVAVVASVEDPARFGEVFDRHYPLIWRYLARTVGPDVADDLAGDVFAAAFCARDRFDPTRGHVRSWLYGIAANRMRLAHRTDGRARRALSRFAREQVTDDDISAVDDARWYADRIERVRNAMLDLDADEFEVLTLVAWEELSYREVAAALAIPVGTVRSRLHRARTRLRALVHEDVRQTGRREAPRP